MTNAKKELINFLSGKGKLKCALVSKGSRYTLKVNYTEKDFNEFLNSLNFEYDSGYGSQELFGTLWFQDGTWAVRNEYDGSEWWELYSLPDVPSELL